MKTINELQNEVIEEFSDFDDWMDKYQLLIDLGNEQEPLAPEYKTEQNLIDGCQSRVWLQAIWKTAKWCSRRKVTLDCKRYHCPAYQSSQRTYSG